MTNRDVQNANVVKAFIKRDMANVNIIQNTGCKFVNHTNLVSRPWTSLQTTGKSSVLTIQLYRVYYVTFHVAIISNKEHLVCCSRLSYRILYCNLLNTDLNKK